jgi:hypothetical protein
MRDYLILHKDTNYNKRTEIFMASRLIYIFIMLTIKQITSVQIHVIVFFTSVLYKFSILGYTAADSK